VKSVPHYYLPNLKLHGEKLLTIVTPSVTFKNVYTGLQPNLSLIAPSTILPTACLAVCSLAAQLTQPCNIHFHLFIHMVPMICYLSKSSVLKTT
jgi:hypothetical protein